MTYALILLKGPLMSFGGPLVSAKKEPTGNWPRLSMLTGLLGNALGLDRSETDRLHALQQSIEYAVREDVRPERLTDYQAVDLGSTILNETGWTTHHAPEERGGANSTGTEQRYRDYLSGGAYTISLASSMLDVGEIRSALLYPARPLFIGRKSCLPSAPLYRGTMDAPSPLDALLSPETFEGDPPPSCRAWHEHEEGDRVSDQRNWSTQMHVGQRQVRETRIFF